MRPIKEGDIVDVQYSPSSDRPSMGGTVEHMPSHTGDFIYIRNVVNGRVYGINPQCATFESIVTTGAKQLWNKACSKPLDVEKVARVAFKSRYPMDRWESCPGLHAKYLKAATAVKEADKEGKLR